jgi:hypothetical protein
MDGRWRGAIHFNLLYTTIWIVDSETEETYLFDIAKPFHGNPNAAPPIDAAYHTQTASAPTQRRAMPSILMHRRLGHRTINTLIIGSKNEVWADTKLRLESDSFCDSCQIVTARSNNHGKSPLDVGTEDMKPGESIMVDLVTNLNKHGLTTSSHYTRIPNTLPSASLLGHRITDLMYFSTSTRTSQ